MERLSVDPLDIIPPLALVQNRLKWHVQSRSREPALSRDRFDPILLEALGWLRSNVKIERAVLIAVQVVRARKRRAPLVGIDKSPGRNLANRDLPELFDGHVRWDSQSVGMGADQWVSVGISLRHHAELTGSRLSRRVCRKVTYQLVPASSSR